MRSAVGSGFRTCRTAVLFSILALATAVPVAAQGEASAAVTGVITDAQGGVLPGVTVTLRNVDSGTVRTTVTETEGQYRVAGLQPGRYDVKAELQGFGVRDAPGLTLTIGLVVQLNLTMSLQGVQESVTVTALAPVVETTTTEVATVVTQEQIEMLPIANRQAGSLALLLPGTQLPTGTRRARPTVGAGGANANLTTSYVDGGNNQLYNSGQEFLEVPQSGIREFRVNISGASAQYSAVGGVVLTATKSGTNQFHGEVFEFFRDTSLNTMDKFEKEAHDTRGTPKPEYRRNQYGGAFGGPILRDRIHFFGAVERTNEPKTVTVRTGQPQFYSGVEENAAAGYERRQVLLRGDMQISNGQSVFLRYLWDREKTLCEECGGSMAGNTGQDTTSPRDSLLMAHTWVISSRALNEIRAQVPPSHLENLSSPPGIDRWPADQRGEFPPERFEDYKGVYHVPEPDVGIDPVQQQQHQTLGHLQRLLAQRGLAHLQDGRRLPALPFERGVDAQHGILDLRHGPVLRRQRRGDSEPAEPDPLHRLVPAAAAAPPGRLDPGLRAGRMADPAEPHDGCRPALRDAVQVVQQSHHPRRPRAAGRAHRSDVAGGQQQLRAAVRAGVGRPRHGADGGPVRRGQVLQQRLCEHPAQRGEHAAADSVSIRNPSYPDPYNGLSPQAFVTVSATPNVNITSDEIEQPEAVSFNGGLSHELRPNLAIHVDGVFSNGNKGNQITNINTPDPVTRVRPIAGWGNILEYTSTGETEYRALYLRLDKRFSDRYQYLVSYTLASDRDQGAGGVTQVDFYHPEYDFGYGLQDRRHTVVASGAVQLPWDITLGAVWNFRSTRPFSARAGIDLNQDGAVTDYVPGTTKSVFNRGNDAEMLAQVNAWRASRGLAAIPESQLMTDEFQRIDMRVSKTLTLGGARRLELIGQVFNLFGTDSFGTGATPWQLNATSNSFGTLNTVYPRQQAELAVRFVW